MKNIPSHQPQPVLAPKVQQSRIVAGAKGCCLLAILLLGVAWITAVPVHAAGGGENMLLIVNPTDEPSLRIANAYVKARNIPVNNILYISSGLSTTPANFTTQFVTPILDTIAARGLTNQIDYIGTIGQPHMVVSSSPSYALSFHDCLNHLTQIQKGLSPQGVIGRYSELFQTPPSSNGVYSYTQGSNPAIYHSRQWPAISGSIPLVQWYMTGMIGYSGVRGLTTTQAIENLQRSVKADGTKPSGTIYFEDSQEVRTTTRSPYWPAIQSYLDRIDIPWIQEKGITPKNRPDVRGAVVGSAGPNNSTQFANGSAYLPGSWADDLTSSAGSYTDGSQTKVSNFLLAGAAGTAGSVTEPYAVQSRFTYANIFIFSNDGSTLGEAFYKSIQQPDLLMLQGDLLSQAYADVPEVQFTGGPADGATVSGVISVGASSRLNNPRIATGITQLRLFVDGLPSGTAVSGSSGSFSLDTTTLTDGIHEVRVVAYNNSQAASEGYALENLVVSNNGQSVRITGTSNYNATWNQVLSIPVVASQGTGPSIASIQLQLLGRSVGSISGASGNVSLDVTQLAYGINTITPVAILSSGTQQVQGTPITVMRQFLQFPGKTPTPMAKRNPGCDFYYFGGAAAGSSTLDTINWNATPSSTMHSSSISITPGDLYRPGTSNMPEAYHSGSYYAYKLAIMINSNFTVTVGGEYSFNPGFGSYTSGGFWVDGTLVSKRDGYNWTTYTNVFSMGSIYLLPGEHTITIKLGNFISYLDAWSSSSSLIYRGPDGNTSSAAAPNFYTVSKRLTP